MTIDVLRPGRATAAARRRRSGQRVAELALIHVTPPERQAETAGTAETSSEL
jgi:hypothetical protein